MGYEGERRGVLLPKEATKKRARHRAMKSLFI